MPLLPPLVGSPWAAAGLISPLGVARKRRGGRERKERRGGPGALSLGALSPPALIAAVFHGRRR